MKKTARAKNARAGIRTRITGLEGQNTNHCTTRATSTKK
jgi:hypothetical protein